MRWIAAILLSSCAPVAVAIPSSLPFVRLDPSLSGAVISREAAIVVATKREQDRAACDSKIIDCATTALVLTHERDVAQKLAATNGWWRVWGPVLAAAAAFLGLGAGFAAGFSAHR